MGGRTDKKQWSDNCQWQRERFVATNTALHSPLTYGSGTDAEVVNIWNDRIQPLIQSLEDLATTLGKDIANMFTNTDMSQEELFLKMGSNLVVNFIEIVKQIVKTFVSLVSKLVIVVKDFGNLK